MEFFEGLVDLIRKPSETDRQMRTVCKEVKSILKQREKELKDAGDRSVSFYNYNMGHDFSFTWDLKQGKPNYISSNGWESKHMHIKVDWPNATVRMFFSAEEEPLGQGQINTQPEYRLAEKSMKLLAQEFNENKAGLVGNQKLTLAEQIDIAMRLAQYVPDGRYEKRLF